MNERLEKKSKARKNWLRPARIIFGALVIGVLCLFFWSLQRRYISDATLKRMSRQVAELNRKSELNDRCLQERRLVNEHLGMAIFKTRMVEAHFDFGIDRIISGESRWDNVRSNRDKVFWLPSGEHTLAVNAYWREVKPGGEMICSSANDLCSKIETRYPIVPERFPDGPQKQWRIELNPNARYIFEFGVQDNETVNWKLSSSDSSFEAIEEQFPFKNVQPEWAYGTVTGVSFSWDGSSGDFMINENLRFPNEFVPGDDLAKPAGIKIEVRNIGLESEGKTWQLLLLAEIQSKAPPCVNRTTAIAMAQNDLDHFLTPSDKEGKCVLDTDAIKAARKEGKPIIVPGRKQYR